MSERSVGEPAGASPARDSFTPAQGAPRIRGGEPALEERPRGSDALTGRVQAEFVKVRESSKIDWIEGTVVHVEVFLGWFV
ncbi:hypothetical protein GCM10009755_13700 [Brevibacterium samyangense]|uniref:Uncharacterized protein n=1 Tax=Brevibacterium samyangense TaxID=366888 RepID=A0ABN2TEK1_9MICO